MSAAPSILLFPYATGFNSRLMNMEKMGRMLLDQGYQVTMLISSEYDPGDRMVVAEQDKTGVALLKFPAPSNVRGISDPEVLDRLMVMSMPEFSSLLLQQQSSYCDALFSHQPTKLALKQGDWNLFILDHIDSCSRLLRDYVDVPSILYSNFGFGVEPELFSPMPLAYAPMPLTPYSDHMCFLQRVRNTLEYAITVLIMYNGFLWPFEDIKTRHGLNISLSAQDAYTRADLVFSNTDFSLDFPRPLMPNVITIGGLFFQDNLPLQGEVAEFANGAIHGLVVVSFGSSVVSVEPGRAEVLAEAFSNLSHLRFVWRHGGQRPAALANNTLLLPWMRQSDLLAHRNTKAFISHCGASGVQEAVQHATPLLGLPLMIDQFYQAAKAVDRAGMGVKMDIWTITPKSLSAAIMDVTTNPTYRANAERLRRRMTDQPISAREKFLFWVEYLLRHRDTSHLKSSVMTGMSWYQYFLLDVIAFLSFCCTLPFYIIYVIFKRRIKKVHNKKHLKNG